MPSPASRDDLEIALASPFSRNTSIALSMFPSQATSAFLQSRTPAPVRPRRVLTLSISIVAIISPHSRRPCCPPPLAPVSYTHLRAHETRHDLVCRLLLDKKKIQ